MNKYIKWIIGITVLVGAGLGIYFITQSSGKIPVEQIEPSSVQVKRTISASGIVKSHKQADLSFSAIGTLEEIAVEKGQDIEQGEFLAYIYNQDTVKSVDSSQQSLEVAKKDLAIYKENYATNVDATGGEDEYYLNVEKLENQVEKARADYESSLAGLNKTRLYAPYDATVIDTFKDENEVVGAGEAIIKIADVSQVYFEIAVDQEDFGFVNEDQKANIDLDAYENRVFEATISDFAKYIDEETNDFVVNLEFDEEGKKNALIGMQGDANVTVAQTQDEVTALAFDQIFSNNGNHYVWIIENGRLVRFPVEIGLEGDIYTQIKTDLSNKTIVVPQQTENVEEGTEAQITNR